MSSNEDQHQLRAQYNRAVILGLVIFGLILVGMITFTVLMKSEYSEATATSESLK